MSNTNDQVQRLQDILGFDPVKYDVVTKDAITEVVKEIQQERLKKVKEKAKEQLIKAIELREQKAKMDREYINNSKKFDKELGSILSQIEKALSGKTSEEENNSVETVQ